MNSNWIFESELLEGTILMLVSGVIAFIGAIYWIWETNSTTNENKSTNNYKLIVLIVVALIFVAIGYWDYSNWKSFYENRMETTGVLIGKRIDRNKLLYKFRYNANNKFYTSERHIICYGKEIQNIKYPNGIYVVFYNRLKHSQATIDFKREVK